MHANMPADVIDALTKRTQDGGTEVVTAKAGKVRRGQGREGWLWLWLWL
jgi:malate/lactate dehydrogenase